MRNYLSLCIWGDGPGRPYDNIYMLKNITFDNNTLHLFFDGDEECIISNPTNINFSEKSLKVDAANKIIWKFYYYGKPKNKETLTIIQYDMINRSQVCILESGAFNNDKIISIKGKIAFDSFGDINFFKRLNIN